MSYFTQQTTKNIHQKTPNLINDVMGVYEPTYRSCLASRKVWGTLSWSLRKSKNDLQKIDFLALGPLQAKKVNFHHFSDFLSENESIPYTFLNVKQDR